MSRTTTAGDVLNEFCQFMNARWRDTAPYQLWEIRLDEIEQWFAEFHPDFWAFINSPGREPAYIWLHARLRLLKPEFYEIALSGLLCAMVREARPQPSPSAACFPDDFPTLFFPNDQSAD